MAGQIVLQSDIDIRNRKIPTTYRILIVDDDPYNVLGLQLMIDRLNSKGSIQDDRSCLQWS